MMKKKYYEVKVKATGEELQFIGKNFKEACTAAGYKPTECHLVYACEIEEEENNG